MEIRKFTFIALVGLVIAVVAVGGGQNFVSQQSVQAQTEPPVKHLPAPHNVKVERNADNAGTRLHVTWENPYGYEDVYMQRIKYRAAGTTTWSEFIHHAQNTGKLIDELTLIGLTPGTVYEVKIGAEPTGNQVSDTTVWYSEVQVGRTLGRSVTPVFSEPSHRSDRDFTVHVTFQSDDFAVGSQFVYGFDESDVAITNGEIADFGPADADAGTTWKGDMHNRYRIRVKGAGDVKVWIKADTLFGHRGDLNHASVVFTHNLKNIAPVWDDDSPARYQVSESQTADEEWDRILGNLGTVTHQTIPLERDELTYTLRPATGSRVDEYMPQYADHFEIDAENNVKLKEGYQLNYEEDHHALFYVAVVADPYKVTDTREVSIEVLDDVEPPEQTTGVRAYAVNDGNATVQWKEPVTNGPAISGYTIEYRKTGGTEWTQSRHPADVYRAQLTSLDLATSYDVRVLARNDEGSGLWSDIVTFTTPSENGPVFQKNSYTFRLPENRGRGWQTPRIEAFGESVVYSLAAAGNPQCRETCGTGIKNKTYVNLKFRVSPSKGRITYQDTGEDYEAFEAGQPAFTLVLQATDANGAVASVPVEIHIEDKAE